MDIQKIQMNNNISFLRIRPCDNNNEIYLNSRRKEGTSAFLIKSELELDINEIHKKDFQTLSKDAGVDSDCWIINDNNWKNFIGINPKRIFYDFKSSCPDFRVSCPLKWLGSHRCFSVLAKPFFTTGF